MRTEWQLMKSMMWLFNDYWNGVQLGEMNREMMGMWTDVIESMRQEGADMIRIHISHQDLTKGDIKIPLQRIEDISPESIMESGPIKRTSENRWPYRDVCGDH